MTKTIVKCPSCAQKLRVPENKGSILVTCNNCKLKWMWEPEIEPVPEPTAAASEKSGVLSWFTRAKQGLTGGAATVYLSPLAASVKPGQDLELQIDVHVSEFELNAKEVTIEFVGEEMIVLPWHSVRLAMGSKFDVFREAWNYLLSSGKFTHQETTFEAEYRVAGKVNWEPSARGEFVAKLQIPPNAVPTFQGQTIASQWRARAVVKTSGVSPKSEWIVVNVVSN